MKIPSNYYGKKFRIDKKGKKSVWLERLDEDGEPTEDYQKVDKQLLAALIANNQVE